MNTEVISSIVYVVVTVMIAIITRYLVPWLKTKIDAE